MDNDVKPVRNFSTTPLTVGDYMLMFLIMIIPIANIIMLFVWGFSENNLNKRNFGRAALIWSLIILVLYLVVASFIFIFFREFSRGFRNF